MGETEQLQLFPHKMELIKLNMEIKLFPQRTQQEDCHMVVQISCPLQCSLLG